ncbi:hypothetical protein [Paludisphaera rhizosphaerae]|uniref:hypothetical protein n=1 Tax=Paludisphaera rhizosphaerae TaxID=2711216 RepID=UPI0013ED4177|nr:hypothetical protein [Paludisphaera rhizosphaerae]
MESTTRPIDLVLDDVSPPIEPDPDDPGSPIDDLLDGLEHDPEESWNAFLGLESLDPEISRPIVRELIAAPLSEGLFRLLHLLGASRDDEIRSAAREALGTNRSVPLRRAATLPAVVDNAPPRLVRSLATAVDGEGLATIVVVSVQSGRISSAAFLCDVRAGIRDVLGQVDDDPEADVDPLARFPELSLRPYVEDVPELAVGLLAGSLMLSGRETPPSVREWLDAILGRGFHPGLLPAARPEWAPGVLDAATLADRAWRILAACPTWVDRSSLTFDLAEEITVRERRAVADPLRDSGAYRFLFERRLLHRLDLYRRMLLWMAFFWDAAGENELASAAGVLSGQLADPQYAVPSHPFTVALSTRSLHEAQRRLGTAEDPRRG